MRRFWWLCGLISVVIVAIGPTQAQGRLTITRTIDARADSGQSFSILQEFLAAAPDIRNRLNRTGSYTFFAPTDRAFRNLESAINLQLTDIIADVDVVTALLTYHLLDTSLSAQDLRQRDGQVIPTGLQDTYVGIRVGTDNTIVVNNVVEVIEANVSASNGTIHVINDVLLTRRINELLDDTFRQPAAATPSPTPVMTPTPAASPTQIVPDGANVRLIHLAPGTSAIDLLLSDQTLVEGLGYGAYSAYVTVPQGIYAATIETRRSDTRITLAVDLTLLNGDFITIIVTGSDEGDDLQTLVLDDDYDDLDDDEARITFLHAVASANAVDLMLGDTVLVNRLQYRESDTVDLPLADETLVISDARDRDRTLAEIEAARVRTGTSTLIALYGSADDPEVLIVTPPLLAENATMIEPTATPGTATAADDSVERSIRAVLEADADLTLLLDALSVVDDALLERLDDAGRETTLLAPSNQAFRNLLSTIGYSEGRLLASTDLLGEILVYHAVDGIITLDDLRTSSGSSIRTLSLPAQAFFVGAASDGRIFLNGRIEIIQADILADNGIIHIIDDVLLPLSALEALGL